MQWLVDAGKTLVKLVLDVREWDVRPFGLRKAGSSPLAFQTRTATLKHGRAASSVFRSYRYHRCSFIWYACLVQGHVSQARAHSSISVDAEAAVKLSTSVGVYWNPRCVLRMRRIYLTAKKGAFQEIRMRSSYTPFSQRVRVQVIK